MNFYLLLRKYFYLKKQINKGDPQLPTGAIQLRVNRPGFPWINQELSQGQAGEGEGIGRTQPPPGGSQHNRAAHCGVSTEKANPFSEKSPGTGSMALARSSSGFLLIRCQSSIVCEPKDTRSGGFSGQSSL